MPAGAGVTFLQYHCAFVRTGRALNQTLAIAAGGAIGAVLRFWMSNGVHMLLGRGFPYGTLLVNVLGSLLMGYLYILMVERLALAPEWRAFALVGLLGAFTTFSTFSVETLVLIEQADYARAAVNVALSVSACLLAAYVGILAARQL